VVAASNGSAPERFQRGLRVFVFPPGVADGQPLEIERSWQHQDELVLKFAGVDTRNDAEALRGAELRIPEQERPPLPPGEYYLSDLVGCRMETVDGRTVGDVADWQDYGAAPLLVVRSGEREILVPFTAAIYRQVEPQNGRIVVEMPAGLEDLNG
jgi:16S rRNA processing protein RimM